MVKKLLTVGELAKRVGVTVRTLHHYDQLGLAQPVARSRVGYRLYNEADVNRLRVVRFLKKLHFSLGEIKSLFADPAFPLTQIMKIHLTRLKERVHHELELYERLERIARFLRNRKNIPLDDIVELLGGMGAGLEGR